MAFQVTSLTIVYPNVYSGADQRKHQSPVSLAFVRGIQNSPVTGEFPAQMVSNAENASIWWRHHGFYMALYQVYENESDECCNIGAPSDQYITNKSIIFWWRLEWNINIATLVDTHIKYECVWHDYDSIPNVIDFVLIFLSFLQGCFMVENIQHLPEETKWRLENIQRWKHRVNKTQYITKLYLWFILKLHYLTLNMLNCFKDYKRNTYILTRIFDLACSKSVKLTLIQEYILSFLRRQKLVCWCSGDFRSQGISRHGIDLQSRNILFPASKEFLYYMTFPFRHQLTYSAQYITWHTPPRVIT